MNDEEKEKTAKFLKLVLEREKEPEYKVADVLLKLLVPATMPYEWDQDFCHDDQEIFFYPVRIPQLVVQCLGDLPKNHKEIKEEKIRAAMMKKIFEIGISTIVLSTMREKS
jgi:hypothetical protein